MLLVIFLFNFRCCHHPLVEIPSFSSMCVCLCAVVCAYAYAYHYYIFIYIFRFLFGFGCLRCHCYRFDCADLDVVCVCSLSHSLLFLLDPLLSVAFFSAPRMILVLLRPVLFALARLFGLSVCFFSKTHFI